MAEQAIVGFAGLLRQLRAEAWDSGDVKTSGDLLIMMAMLQQRADRTSDAAAQLREGFQIAMLADSLELIRGLNCCGHL